jgi:hypothetical protein
MNSSPFYRWDEIEPITEVTTGRQRPTWRQRLRRADLTLGIVLSITALLGVATGYILALGMLLTAVVER